MLIFITKTHKNLQTEIAAYFKPSLSIYIFLLKLLKFNLKVGLVM